MTTGRQKKKAPQSTEPIPASPEDVAHAQLNSPPRKPGEWKYLGESKRIKTHKSA